MSTHVAENEVRPDVPKQITVTVNGKPVNFDHNKATGLEIKSTAIKQHVPIKLDFGLFEVKGPGHLKQIGDNETVTLHPHQEFRAVAPDDNSETKSRNDARS